MEVGLCSHLEGLYMSTAHLIRGTASQESKGLAASMMCFKGDERYNVLLASHYGHTSYVAPVSKVQQLAGTTSNGSNKQNKKNAWLV